MSTLARTVYVSQLLGTYGAAALAQPPRPLSIGEIDQITEVTLTTHTALDLDAAAAAIAAEQAAREAGRGRVYQYIVGELARLPVGDAARAPYEAAKSHLDAAEARAGKAAQAARAENESVRADVRVQLD